MQYLVLYLFHMILQSPLYLTFANLATSAMLSYLFIIANIFIWKNLKLFKHDGDGN